MSTIGDRIRIARKQAGLNQPSLASRIGVTKSAVSQWEGDQTKNIEGKNLLALARELSVDPDWLLTGKGEMKGRGADNVSLSPAPPDTRRIPVINYIQAGEPKSVIDDHAPGNGIDDIWVDPELAESLGPYAFALTVKGDSMTPKFQPGDRIIVDPDIAPRPGEFVVAKMGREEETTLKKYRARGTDENGSEIFELVPLNNDFATILVNEDNPGQIIGTVMEHRSRTRR